MSTFHLEDYGGAGDGATDNTAAFKAALSAMAAAGGGTLQLLAGVYLVSADLTNDRSLISIQTPVTITGAGSGYTWAGPTTLGAHTGTVIVQKTFPAPIFAVAVGGSGTLIENIAFVNLETKLLIEQTSPSSGSQVQVLGTGKYFGEAIYLGGAGEVAISGCSFNGLVTGNKAVGPSSVSTFGAGGLYATNQAFGNTVRNCVFDHCDYGILASSQANFVYSDCQFTHIENSQGAATPPHGIYCNGNQPSSGNPIGTQANPIQRGSGGLIQNCTFDGNPYASGIKVKFQDNLVVRNLTVTNCERFGDFESCASSTFTDLVGQTLVAPTTLPDSQQMGWDFVDCNSTAVNGLSATFTLDVPGLVVRYSNSAQDGSGPQCHDVTISGLVISAAYSAAFAKKAAVVVAGGTRVTIANPALTNTGAMAGYPFSFTTGGGGLTPAGAANALQGCAASLVVTPALTGFLIAPAN